MSTGSFLNQGNRRGTESQNPYFKLGDPIPRQGTRQEVPFQDITQRVTFEANIAPELRQFVDSASAAANDISGFSNFQTPSQWNPFAAGVTETGKTIGAFPDQIGTAQTAADTLDRTLSGALRSAKGLTEGSFSGQAGVIPEAIGLTGQLSAELGKITVPDITPEAILPSEEVLATEMGKRQPSAFAIDDFLPTREVLATEMGKRQPGAFTVGDFLPQIGRADLLEALPGQRILGSDILPQIGREDLFRTLPGQRLGAGDILPQILRSDLLGALPEQTLGASDILPQILRPDLLGALPEQALGVGDVLPQIGRQDLLGALPGQRLGVADILPQIGREDLFRALPSQRLGVGDILPQIGREDLVRALPSQALGVGDILPQIGREDLFRALPSQALGVGDILPEIGRADLLGTLPEQRLGVGDVLPQIGREDLLGTLPEQRLGVGDILPQIGREDLFRALPGEGLTPSDVLPQIGRDNLLDQLAGERILSRDILPSEEDLARTVPELRPAPFLPSDLLPTRELLTSTLAGLRPDAFLASDLLPTEEQLASTLEELIPGAGGVYPPAGKPAGPGDTGEPGDTGDPAELEGMDKLLADLQSVITTLTTGPTTAEELRADPLTASLLMDLEKRNEEDREQAREDLNRLGLMDSGNRIDIINELRAGQRRAEASVLGDAAERYRTDRISGLTGGTDLFGTASQRELGLDELDLSRQQTDLDIIAAITAALDPDLDLKTGDPKQKNLAAMLLGLTGIPDVQYDQLLDLIGLDPEQRTAYGRGHRRKPPTTPREGQ